MLYSTLSIVAVFFSNARKMTLLKSSVISGIETPSRILSSLPSETQMSLNLFLFVGAFVILLSFGFQRDWWGKVDLGNFCHNINSKSGESLHAVRYVCLGYKLI